jgi:hypothetical protein
MNFGAASLLLAFKKHIGVVLVALAVFAIVFEKSFNFTTEMHLIKGSYVRWTQVFTMKTPTNRVFVDLHDGRSVIASADPNWVPPSVGSEVTIEEHIVLFGGSRFRMH